MQTNTRKRTRTPPHLLHAVEGGASLEPLNLLLVEGVLQRHFDLRAVRLGQHPANHRHMSQAELGRLQQQQQARTL